MDLVDEEDRSLAGHLTRPGLLRRPPQVRHPRGDATDGDHVCPGLPADHLSQGRLAAAGRSPEDHRGEAVLLDRSAQRLAWADEMLLPHEVVERPRAHARRKRGLERQGRVREPAHGFAEHRRLRRLALLFAHWAARWPGAHPLSRHGPILRTLTGRNCPLRTEGHPV
jgi:hypothetical protein